MLVDQSHLQSLCVDTLYVPVVPSTLFWVYIQSPRKSQHLSSNSLQLNRDLHFDGNTVALNLDLSYGSLPQPHVRVAGCSGGWTPGEEGYQAICHI